MSPRAAWRLERLGFAPVFDYAGGKMDWLAYDLGHEGEARLAGDVVTRDVPTCRLDERVADVAARLAEQPASLCVALNDAGIVMGIVPGDILQARADARVEGVMVFGVTTIRPSAELGPLLERMHTRHVEAIVVTRPDATLLGLLVAEEAEQAVH